MKNVQKPFEPGEVFDYRFVVPEAGELDGMSGQLLKHVWDLLTQCVVGSLLESMMDVAKSRGDTKHALRWRDRCCETL